MGIQPWLTLYRKGSNESAAVASLADIDGIVGAMVYNPSVESAGFSVGCQE